MTSATGGSRPLAGALTGAQADGLVEDQTPPAGTMPDAHHAQAGMARPHGVHAGEHDGPVGCRQHQHPDHVAAAGAFLRRRLRPVIEFTTMTYRSHVGAGTANYTLDEGDYPQSFMMLDIAALKAMYGADFFSGATVDSVYTFSDTTGEMFINGIGQGTPFRNTLFRTVWDNGGNDTYGFSNYIAFESMRIDLRPSDPNDPGIGWTDVDVGTNFQAARLSGGSTATLDDDVWARGQLANAMLFNGDTRSLIENAISGAGDDTVLGNQGRNRLEGRGGVDSLAGLDGDDTLIGGQGAGFVGDTLDGGNGTDLASYADSGEAVRVDLSGVYGKGVGGTAQGDVLIPVEDIIGTYADYHGDQGPHPGLRQRRGSALDRRLRLRRRPGRRHGPRRDGAARVRLRVH